MENSNKNNNLNIKPSGYKTKLCKWDLTGRCKHGISCNFIHVSSIIYKLSKKHQATYNHLLPKVEEIMTNYKNVLNDKLPDVKNIDALKKINKLVSEGKSIIIGESHNTIYDSNINYIIQTLIKYPSIKTIFVEYIVDGLHDEPYAEAIEIAQKLHQHKEDIPAKLLAAILAVFITNDYYKCGYLCSGLNSKIEKAIESKGSAFLFAYCLLNDIKMFGIDHYDYDEGARKLEFVSNEAYINQRNKMSFYASEKIKKCSEQCLVVCGAAHVEDQACFNSKGIANLTELPFVYTNVEPRKPFVFTFN
jgi:hypothetical protein